MTNERAEIWLRELGYNPEPEPDWVTDGRRADFFCEGDSPCWVEVKTLLPPRHHELMGRAWTDLRARCERVSGVTGDLYAVVGDTYDERAARWLLAAIEREARSSRLLDVVSVASEPIYEVTARFWFRAEDGEVSQIAAKSRSQRYPLYPARDPVDWGERIEVTYSDGTASVGLAYEVFEEPASASLAARIFRSTARLSLRGTLGASAQENRSVWRVREVVASAGQQLRNCQRYQPAPGICAIY